jgi:flagellar hook-length control protein FliK
LDHLPALRDRLAEQNIRVERFDVDVRRDGSESQADTRGSRHQQFQQPSEQPTPRRQSATQSRPAMQPQPQVRATTSTVSDNGLNLIV